MPGMDVWHPVFQTSLEILVAVIRKIRGNLRSLAGFCKVIIFAYLKTWENVKAECSGQTNALGAAAVFLEGA
jgi:hypothetical protein